MIRLHMSSVMLKIFPLKMIYNLLANVVFSFVKLPPTADSLIIYSVLFEVNITYAV